MPPRALPSSAGARAASPLTLTTVLPQAEVHGGNLLAAHHALWVRCHPEDVPLELLDVVTVVTDDSSEGRLSDLSQLGRREDSGVLIPKSAVGCNHSGTQEMKKVGSEASSPAFVWQHLHPSEGAFILESGGCGHSLPFSEPLNLGGLLAGAAGSHHLQRGGTPESSAVAGWDTGE